MPSPSCYMICAVISFLLATLFSCSLGCYKEHRVTSCEAKSERVAIGKVIDERLDRGSSESTAGLVDGMYVIG